MEDKIDIMSLTKSELKDFFTEIGEKPFRAKQLFSWLHNKCVYDYDDMTNLSKSLRDTLKEKTYISHIKPYNVQRSALDPIIAFWNEAATSALLISTPFIFAVLS